MKKTINIFFLILILTIPLKAKSINISQAIQLALKNNPDLIQEKKNLEKANMQIQMAWSTLFPNIKLETSISKLDSYTTRLTAPTLGELSYYQTKASLSQLIFGLHAFPAITASQLAKKIAQNHYDDKSQQIILDITKAYINILKAQELYKLTSNGLERTKAYQNLIQNMFKVGLVNKADTLQVKVKLNSTQTKLLETEQFLKLSKLQFNLLLGKPLNQQFELDKNIHLDFPNLDKLNQANILKKALQRPSITALKNTQNLLKQNEFAINSKSWPTVYLVANYGFIDTDTFKFTNTNKDWMITLSASWTIFDGFSTSAQTKEAQIEYTKTKTALHNAKKALQLKTINSLLSLKIAKQSIKNNKASVNLAQENLNIKEEQFQAGSATSEDVLNAQFLLDQAQTNLIQAKYDYLLAKLNIKYLMGTLTLQSFKN